MYKNSTVKLADFSVFDFDTIMDIPFVYNPTLFEEFLDIGNNDIYTLIRFYERHEKDLWQINSEERFIVLCYYCNALYISASPEKHLAYADRVLEGSILESIQYVDGKDVFVYTLYQKIHSHIKLRQYEEAIRLAKQLLHIAPKQKRHVILLRKTLLIRRPIWVQKGFALALLGIIIWTGMQVTRIMLLEAFFPILDQLSFFIQNIALWAGCLALIIAITGHYIFVSKTMLKTIRSANKKKFD